MTEVKRVDRPAERRERNREAVLAAAERRFAAAGYGATKVADVAAAAGVSLATLYSLFEGKAELWDLLHEQRMSALLADVDAVVRVAVSPLDRLLDGVGAVARFLMGHEDYLALSLAAGGGWVAPVGGSAGGSVSGSVGGGVQRTVWSAGLDRIAAGVAAARDAGELTDLRPRIAAQLVVSALQVWLADWVESGRDRDPEVVVAELVGRLRHLLAVG